jgi:hypothetical protein
VTAFFFIEFRFTNRSDLGKIVVTNRLAAQSSLDGKPTDPNEDTMNSSALARARNLAHIREIGLRRRHEDFRAREDRTRAQGAGV